MDGPAKRSGDPAEPGDRYVPLPGLYLVDEANGKLSMSGKFTDGEPGADPEGPYLITDRLEQSCLIGFRLHNSVNYNAPPW